MWLYPVTSYCYLCQDDLIWSNKSSLDAKANVSAKKDLDSLGDACFERFDPTLLDHLSECKKKHELKQCLLEIYIEKTQYLRHPETNHPWPDFLERNPFEAWRFDESSDLFLEMMQLQEKDSSAVIDFFFPSLFPANSCSYRDSFFKYIWGLCYLGSLLVYQLSFLIYTHLQRGGGQTLAAKIADMADFSWNIYSFEFHNCAQYLLRIYCMFLDVWIIQEDRVTEQHIPINPVIKVLMIDIDFETRVNFIRSYLPNIDIATIAD